MEKVHKYIYLDHATLDMVQTSHNILQKQN